MAFKLKTSKKSEEIFSRIEASENLPFYVTVKLAMAMSLRSEKPLDANDFNTNALGRELNRQTITGDADALYKCLMEIYSNKHLTDEELSDIIAKTDARFIINSDAHAAVRVGEIRRVEEQLARINFPLDRIDNIDGRLPNFRFSEFKKHL